MDTVPSTGKLGSGSLTLHLGVDDIPYRFDNPIKGFKSTKHLKARKPMSITTGDVAEILEAKYGLMAAFWKAHGKDGAKAIENSLQGALEALMMKRVIDPWGSAMQTIQSDFRDFISSREAERVGIKGTPTGAALWAINHRLAHPYAHNPRRASFRDSGLFMASFRAWAD